VNNINILKSLNRAMNNIDWIEISKQLLTILLTLIIGLILGYYGHILTLRREKERYKRLLSIKCSLSSYYQPEDLNILAVNVGYHPVTIVDAGVRFSNGHSDSYKDWELPKRLDDGEFIILKAPVNGLWQTMMEDSARIDSVWVREAEGKLFEITIPEQIKDRIQI
jgi:hypothetical protein